MTDKFMFFDNFKTTADKLPDDLRLKFYDALTDYVFKGIEPDDAIISALITAFKPSLDKVETRGGNHNPTGQNQYTEVKKGQKEVKKGQSGQSFLETETRNKKQETKENTPNGVQKKKISFDDTPKKFIKPKIEEIVNYCREGNNSVDASRFFDFYESKGWKVGKNPMKDWRAAVRTWEKEDKARGGANTARDEEFYRKLEAM